MRRRWMWMVLAAGLPACSESGDSLTITRLTTYTDSLGQVRGGAFGEVGSIYVADPLMKAVFRLNDSGVQNLFPNGMGPGEVMQPVDVSFMNGTLSVLDAGKGGTSTFSGGEFVSFRPEDFGPGTRYVGGTDSTQNPLSAMVRADAYANSCRSGGRTYEMTVVDGSDLSVQGTQVLSIDDEQVIVPLGIACSDEFVVMGYGLSGRLYYRFYDSDMQWIGSREFASADDPDVLGVIFALRGDTLLTGRNRPLPRVELWSIEW